MFGRLMSRSMEVARQLEREGVPRAAGLLPNTGFWHAGDGNTTAIFCSSSQPRRQSVEVQYFRFRSAVTHLRLAQGLLQSSAWSQGAL